MNNVLVILVSLLIVFIIKREFKLERKWTVWISKFTENFIHKHICEFPRNRNERIEYLEKSIERLVEERNSLVGFDGEYWNITKRNR